MSFSTAGRISLSDNTPATVNYDQSQSFGSKAIYSDRSRDIGLPRTLEISHQDSGSGTLKRTRSMCRLNDIVENAQLEGDTEGASIYLVVDRGHRLIDKADLTHMVAQLISLLGTPSDFVDKIANKEV